MVNLFSVKKIKELDDNSPKKMDAKDPKIIAKLVVDGRYSIPYMPEGIYAEIRDLVYSRDRIMKQNNISQTESRDGLQYTSRSIWDYIQDLMPQVVWRCLKKHHCRRM